MFTLNLIKTPKLTRTDGKIRLYSTPEGNHYPSVTTVLDKTMTKDERLQNWIDAIGIKESTHIANVAKKRGDVLHKTVEHYILDPVNFTIKGLMPTTIQQFKQIRKELDKSLSVVRGIEVSLYSDSLKIAGTTDLIGQWNGHTSIIDHKTAKSEKHYDDIESYFIQETCYSLMLQEMKGIYSRQIVTIIANDDTIDAQVFIEDRDNFKNQAIGLIDKWYNDV